MKLRYLALLRIEGEKITGSAEKVWENSINGEREYVGKNRSTAKFNGHIKKKFFGDDEIVLNFDENGHGRPYTTQHILNVIDKNSLKGRFASTAANKVGECSWVRKTT